jgi:hypothetical protein
VDYIEEHGAPVAVRRRRDASNRGRDRNQAEQNEDHSARSPRLDVAQDTDGNSFVSGIGTIWALDARAPASLCSGTPKVCNPLWSARPSDSGVVLSAVAVANGFIYAAGEQLHAFAKP